MSTERPWFTTDPMPDHAPADAYPDDSPDLPTHPYDAGTADPLTVLVERFNALTRRGMNARAAEGLKARGEYDPDRHGVIDTPPLTEAEHLAVLAYGSAIALATGHPSYVHDAVRAGVPWAKIARALDRHEVEVRDDYVRWANRQRELARTVPTPDGMTIGMSEADYTEALARARVPAAEQERLFGVGVRVRLHVDLNVSWIDDDLAAEGPGARVRVRQPRGSIGVVTRVRTWPTPFPYVVMFGDQEVSVREHDLERVAAER